MGLDDLRLMGFRDKTIEFEDDEKMVKLVDRFNRGNESISCHFILPWTFLFTQTMMLRLGQLFVQCEEWLKQNALRFIHLHLRIIRQKYLVNLILFMMFKTLQSKKLPHLNAHASQTVWMMKEMETKLAAKILKQ